MLRYKPNRIWNLASTLRARNPFPGKHPLRLIVLKTSHMKNNGEQYAWDILYNGKPSRVGWSLAVKAISESLVDIRSFPHTFVYLYDKSSMIASFTDEEGVPYCRKHFLYRWYFAIPFDTMDSMMWECIPKRLREGVIYWNPACRWTDSNKALSLMRNRINGRMLNVNPPIVKEDITRYLIPGQDNTRLQLNIPPRRLGRSGHSDGHGRIHEETEEDKFLFTTFTNLVKDKRGRKETPQPNQPLFAPLLVPDATQNPYADFMYVPPRWGAEAVAATPAQVPAQVVVTNQPLDQRQLPAHDYFDDWTNDPNI